MKRMLIFTMLVFTIFLFFCEFVKADCYFVKDGEGGFYTKSPMVGPGYDEVKVDDYYCSNKVTCGSMGSFHKKIPELTSWLFTLIQIAVPVLLVIFGSIDFVKAIISQKDDEIKKGQQTFIKRIIVAIMIFFMVVIVKMLVSVLSGDDNEKSGILDCIDCFISNDCRKTAGNNVK